MHIILGLIIISAGVAIVMKTEFLLRNFGRIYFFEKYFGVEGGSRLGYKIMGIFAITIGVLILTNMIKEFLNWLLYPLIRYM